MNDSNRTPQIVTPDFVNSWRDLNPTEESENTYHADKSAIASGDIKSFLKSPAHFQHFHFTDEEKEESDAMRFGRAAHTMLLEPEKFKEKFIAKPDFGDMRKPANRAERDIWLSDLPKDLIPCSTEDLAVLTGIMNSLQAHPVGKQLFKEGFCEAIGYYRDPETGLKCRIKPDFVSQKRSAVIDFKTTRDARKFLFAKTMYENRYDIQAAHYAAGIKIIEGWEPKRRILVVVEKKPPFAVAVYCLGHTTVEKSDLDRRYALDGIANCLVTNSYESYQTEAEDIDLPAYAFWD